MIALGCPATGILAPSWPTCKSTHPTLGPKWPTTHFGFDLDAFGTSWDQKMGPWDQGPWEQGLGTMGPRLDWLSLALLALPLGPTWARMAPIWSQAQVVPNLEPGPRPQIGVQIGHWQTTWPLANNLAPGRKSDGVHEADCFATARGGLRGAP